MLEDFKENFQEYLAKAILSVPVLLALFLLLHTQNLAIVSSIGSTAFLVFALTDHVTSSPRHVIGGHLIGVASGLAAGLLPQGTVLLGLLSFSIAIALSIFLMLALKAEHPPAAGTALGIALAGFDWLAVGGIIVSVVILSLVRESIVKYVSPETEYFK